MIIPGDNPAYPKTTGLLGRGPDLRFLFGEHVLDTARRELRRGGERIELEPQVFDLFVYLLQNRERVVSKDDLLASVWGGRIVSDATLDSRIAAARRAVGDSGAVQTLIRTFARKGVRFVGGVQEEGKPAAFAPKIAAEPETAARPGGVRSPPRLSIVVLPFANLSDDREQQYFAEGITEDLTTDLSRLANMFVISRNTAFTYRNKPVDTKQIGRELGVRYVLEGSVRRSSNRVRVSAQLIDAATDAHLWAERFDRDTADLFALQNEITRRLASALGVELIAAEAARPTEHPDVLDYILRGRAVLLRPRTPDSHREAINLFEHALALDPQSVEAQGRLAGVLVTQVLLGMTDPASAEPDIARAEELVDRALTASPRFALAHVAKGHVLRVQRRWEEAIPEYEAALALEPNAVFALINLGWCKLRTGSIEEVTPLVQQAIRLSPRDPHIGACYHLIGTVHLLQSHIDEAIAWLEKARGALPGVPAHRSHLAAAYALRGETDRAAAELAEARRLSSGDRFASVARLKAYPGGWWGVPKSLALFEATYFAGLRKAGMPEE